MEKIDLMKTAEKIRADLNDEFDKDLEEVMEDSKKREVSSEDEEKEKEQEAKKEGTKKGDRYRDEYFEKMKDYKPEKKGGKEANSEAKKEAEAREKPSWEKLEALRKELEKAREEYIRNDYEMDKKSNKFAKMFGFRAGLGNFKEEIEEYKNNYEEALKKYKDAVIDSEHVEDEEDVEIVARWLVARECLNLRSGREDVRMSENPKYEKFKKFFLGAVNKYRKLCALPGKIVSKEISRLTGSKWAGLGLGLSAGAGVMGVAFSHAGVATIPLQVFSGLVSTVGYKQILEAGAEKRRVKKEEKEIEKVRKATEELESINFERIKGLLDGKISEMDSQMQNEKQRRQWRTLMAIVAGTATAFGGHWLGHHAAEYLKGHFHGGAPEVSHGGSEGTIPSHEAASGAHKEAIKEQVKQALHNPKFDTLGETAPGAEAAGGLELNTEAVSGVEIAKSGDSIWKMAEHQLENRGYFKGLTGTPEEILAKKTYLIDAIKDKIAENPKDFGLVDADKIQVGQKIDFSSIFENKNDIGNIIDKAESLGRSDIENIARNLAGESSLHGTETVNAETPVAETSMETPAPEATSEIEMQNQLLAEMKIARTLGLNSHEYSAINDTSVSKLLSEMDKFQELGAKKYIPDLPHDGIYGNPERYKHLRLAEFIKSQLNNVPEGDRLSIKEFLMKVDLESLPEDSVVMAKHISMEMGEEDLKYLAGVLRRETAETIRTCAVNIESWNNIKNALVVNSGQNEIVENIKTAVSKVLPEGAAKYSDSDTVENWMIKITKEAYKRGLADDLREQLLRHKT